ncbi:MAG: efflux RND transporter permease subunit [Burkholderiales bacterium]
MLEGAIRHGTLLAIGVLIVCVFGVLAVMRVPVQMIPDLETRVITVRTSWPGATPQDVEKELLIEQEEYLRSVPSLQRMVSTATMGEARIELEFPFGVDVNNALIRVNNALSQVPAYPENVDEPRLYTTSFSDNAFIFLRVMPLPGNPQGVNMNMMRDFIDDNVRARFERVRDVSEVRIGGGAERQVQIFVDPGRLAERGLTLTGLRTAIRERNLDVSGGDLESGKRRYLLRTMGRFENLADIQSMVIAERGGTIVRLRDVASVRLHHFEIRQHAFTDGEPIVSLSIRRNRGSNVIAIKEAVLPVIEQLNREVLEPAGMRMALTTDDVRYVQASIANVWTNLAIGACLATLVMFLFLRSVSATLVGIIGVPICAIAAFLGLLLAGRTINVISLAGVAFAIGMTLDNSIVVLESIVRERARGLDRLQAAIAGVRRVWPAVLASTLTTVLVFAPVLFLVEEAGQLYSDVAVAIAASIFVSMLVAVTVVPAASARFAFGGAAKTQDVPGKRRMVRALGALFATRPRRTACLVGTLAAMTAAMVLLTPPAEYLPEGEEAKSFSMMIPPTGYNLTEMSAIADRLHEEFLPHLDSDPGDFDNRDGAIPALEYFIVWVRPQYLRVIAETKDPKHINALMRAIDARFEQYPGMRSFSTRGSIISSNDGGTRSVNLDIAGPELAAIYDVALAAYLRAREVFDDPQVRPDPPTLTLGQPMLELRPRWERAAELGLTTQEVGYAVAGMTNGAYVDEFFLADDKIDIYLYTTTMPAGQLGDIESLPVYTPQGTVLPVGAIVDMVETVDTDTIRRVDGRRTVTLNIIPPRSVALETGVEIVQSDLIEHLRANGAVPAEVSLDISGASDRLQATREALSGNYAVAILLCYLLLVAVFTNWGYPLLIMTAVPLGIAGGIVGLWLLNVVGAWLPAIGLQPIRQPLDMITMLGFLILVGTVVNNPILLVDRALHNLRKAGMDAVQAVKDAVQVRLRPILMSSITTIFGLAPLVFIPGAGTELYRGVGVIVLFGLMFATIVTLVFLPSLLVEVFTWRSRRAATAAAAQP